MVTPLSKNVLELVNMALFGKRFFEDTVNNFVMRSLCLYEPEVQ